jgi:hypothetical protein
MNWLVCRSGVRFGKGPEASVYAAVGFVILGVLSCGWLLVESCRGAP